MYKGTFEYDPNTNELSVSMDVKRWSGTGNVSFKFQDCFLKDKIAQNANIFAAVFPAYFNAFMAGLNGQAMPTPEEPANEAEPQVRTKPWSDIKRDAKRRAAKGKK